MSVPWYLMARGKGGGYKTASGPIVSVNDALAAPLRSLRVVIDPVQDLHGYDSPWPAGGGKQLIPFPYVTSTGSGSTGSINYVINTDGSVKINGSVSGGAKYIWLYGSASTPMPSWMLPATEYTLSGGIANTRIQVIFYGDSTAVYQTSGTTKTTFTTPADFTNYTAFGVVIQCMNNTSPDGTVWPMLELGPTATSYAPYSNICPISGWSECNVWVKPTYDPTANPTATLQLGQTVYGGTLDVTNGVLTVDRKVFSLDSVTFSYSSANGCFYYQGEELSDIKTALDSVFMCSCYKPDAVSASSLPDYSIAGYYASSGTTHRIYVKDSRAGTDPETLKALVSGQTCVIKLATPITIPLTATQISTLQGQNVVWADCGDVTVEYLASGGANADLMKLAVAFMGRE